MKRLRFLLLVLSAGLAAELVAASSRRPNVIFILADDLGWGDLSCYGNTFLRTPNLDRLAAGGSLFTSFYTSGPVCSPSRAGFFTGRYPARDRIHGHFATRELNESRGMSSWLDPRAANVAGAFRSAGYTTAHVGKWHLGNDAGGPAIADYGFDFVGSGEGGGAGVRKDDPYYRARSTALFVDEALRFISGRGERPFYLQLWALLPHATLNPTPEQMEPFLRLSNRDIAHPSARTLYYASVADLDREIGRLLDRLAELGLADDTIIVFSSDNGPEEIFILNAGHSGVGSPGPFRGRKRSLYEGGVRVPFLVRWPGRVPAGRVDDATVIGGIDFMPSLCALAGVRLPEGHAADGEDLSRALLGGVVDRARPLMWEWRFGIAGHVINRSPQLSIRDGEWKLLLNPDRSRVELYAINRDPSEIDNLAAQHPDVVDRLARRVLEWQRGLPAGPADATAGRNDYPWPGRPPPPAPARGGRKAKSD
ncbi:MAG: Arylsulfatase [Verrucomicrobiota bacterium]|jgi:arylsulfatase A-like enzyme